MRTTSVETFSRVIQKIYAAAADPAQWGDALRDLEDATGSVGATLVFVPRTANDQGMVLSGRFSDDVCAEFARDQMAHCPRTEYVGRTGANLFYDSMIMTEAEMDRDPVYDWFGRLGLRYCIGGVLATDDRWNVNISLQRSRAQGHVERADVDTYLHFRSHLVQALTLTDMLGSLRSRERASAVMLERLPQGVVLVGADRRIIYANAAADRILSSSALLSAKVNQFSLADAALDARLEAMIAAATGLTSGTAVDASGWLTARHPGLAPLHMFVGPALPSLDPGLSARPMAMVILHDRSAGPQAPIAMLTDLFGLTMTEARLAALLGGGAALESAALQLGQAVGTARIHLKSIFRKMGVDRQQDMVRVLSGLVSQGFTGGAAS